MNRKLVTHSSMAAALLLSAAPLAMAASPQGQADWNGTATRSGQSTTQSVSPRSAVHERWEKAAPPPKSDVKPFEQAKLSLSQPHTMPLSHLKSTLKQDATAAKNAQTTLTDAVDKAQQYKGGKAIMASIKAKPNGAAAYDLDLVKNGKLRTAMVNAGSGQLR